ncbi:anti-sigma factor [Cohnella sp. AR92]|uniref:anti-sigma factor family protein n=1 Tax=Cohnella sp. AR92 TaxID=648716 RepID=UPI000F8DF6A6|nr:anti-sigma factor [Cohnella sp. AR92]RUS48190.1 hypothetical protein ELR57_06585 [Cohnella sp. AR92]
MKSDCGPQQERFVDYLDDTLTDHERLKFEKHLASCPSCKREYRLWEETAMLIRDVQFNEALEVDLDAAEEVNRKVMNRIYAEEKWHIPAAKRKYAFNGRFRRRVSAMLASVLAIFFGGLVYAIYRQMQSTDTPYTGVMETASAMGGGDSMSGGMVIDVPVASLSDPIILHVDPAVPPYWIAFALLGVLMALLTMNWFARVRT